MLELAQYDYELPAQLIAQEPATPRDSARLFVYDTLTDTVAFDTFRNIGAHLPHPSLLVMNDTKVSPARAWLTKETGGKIEVLFFLNELKPGDRYVKGVVDRKINPGATLSFPGRPRAKLHVRMQRDQFFFFEPTVSFRELHRILSHDGRTPIPPYIKHPTQSEAALRKRYQSVFARHPSSVAAPTASLHFTAPLISRLKHSGVDHAKITLHVGAGTFSPISEHNLATKKLFTEYYSISHLAASAISDAKRSGIPVIPVGTTAMRALESSAISHSRIRPCEGRATDIFIFPPHNFRIADALVTNFHVPRSSLMLLVDAFLMHKKSRRRILDLYKIAVGERFRFYSFGDAMLLK